mmetsp:Transcript_3546/g.6567  ORF Transcript_3546/g.6567 Transcript_3546/m.6567 type:complete len:83 (+) Transcript_3546:273-521(+)
MLAVPLLMISRIGRCPVVHSATLRRRVHFRKHENDVVEKTMLGSAGEIFVAGPVGPHHENGTSYFAAIGFPLIEGALSCGTW